jgi:hypothetical protein
MKKVQHLYLAWSSFIIGYDWVEYFEALSDIGKAEQEDYFVG